MNDLREALRRYLRDRPNAADTLAGIARWWLPESMQEISLERLEEALADLIASNEVRCTRLSDGTELYSRRGGGRDVPADHDVH
jgi:hypothetical protein